MSIRVLSYGGGTQSAALALMSASGEVDRLDAVIFADTHGELPETYAYADYVAGRLAAVGIPFLRVSVGSLEDALRGGPRPSGRGNPTPPVSVRNSDGSIGRIGQYRCSFDFKRQPITREVKAMCGARGAWKRSRVEQWLGFSIDEAHRCRQDNECRCGHLMARHEEGGCSRCACEQFDRWRVNRFPLIEMGWRRDDTIAWFAANGHPTPPRSACWFCPNSRNERWAALRQEHPDLWERACTLDEAIRKGGAFVNKDRFRGEMFLHQSAVPLRLADLRTITQRRRDAGESGMFDLDACTVWDCGT